MYLYICVYIYIYKTYVCLHVHLNLLTSLLLLITLGVTNSLLGDELTGPQRASSDLPFGQMAKLVIQLINLPTSSIPSPQGSQNFRGEKDCLTLFPDGEVGAPKGIYDSIFFLLWQSCFLARSFLIPRKTPFIYLFHRCLLNVYHVYSSLQDTKNMTWGFTGREQSLCQESGFAHMASEVLSNIKILQTWCTSEKVNSSKAQSKQYVLNEDYRQGSLN